MPDPKAVTLHASGVETATGAGSAVDLAGRLALDDLTLEVTDATGTSPTLEAFAQTAISASGPWRTVKAFNRATSAGATTVPLTAFDRYARAAWTLSGTSPAFTFSIKATAVQMYVMPSDVLGRGNALPPDMIGRVTPDELLMLCLAASLKAEGFLAAAYEMPIVTVGAALPTVLADMVAAQVLFMRGIVGGGIDPMSMTANEEALNWLNKIARGTIRPPDIIDSMPEIHEEGAYAVSRALRGY